MIEKGAFAEGMGLLAGAFKTNLDAAVSRVYYSVLSQRLTTEEFMQAIYASLETDTFWPPPAALIAKVKKDDDGESALMALRHVNATMGRFGGFQYLPFAEYDKFDAATKAAIKAVGGLADIANTPIERYQGLSKRFAKGYLAALDPQKSLSPPTTEPRVKQLVRDTASHLSGRDRAVGRDA